jgi:hypothetical protein
VFSVQCSVFRGVSCETHETASETHAIPEAGLRRFNASSQPRPSSVFSVQWSVSF